MSQPVRSGPDQEKCSWPAGVRQVASRRMSRSLDFYRALGFDVASTADGWVLLRAAGDQFVLVQSSAREPARAPVLHLCATDLAGVGGRLVAAGAAVGARTYSARTPGGRFAASDPDGNVVVITGHRSAARVAEPRDLRPPSNCPLCTDAGMGSFAGADEGARVGVGRVASG